MEFEYELKTEIKICKICKDWIDCTNKLVIIKHQHFHKECLVSLLITVQ
jgi:hypothetical protein